MDVYLFPSLNFTNKDGRIILVDKLNVHFSLDVINTQEYTSIFDTAIWDGLAWDGQI